MPPKAPTPWTLAAGRFPVVHVTAHMHWPFWREPTPVVAPVLEPELAVPAEAAPVLAEPAAEPAAEPPAAAPVEFEAAEPEVPPVMAEPAPVPFCAMAIDWNMAWVLAAVGLMEKVMPFPQWPF